VGSALVREIACDVEAFVQGGFDLREERGDFIGGGSGENAGRVEEEIAVVVGSVVAGGFEEDGVGGGFDQCVDGGGEGCEARNAYVAGVGHRAHA